MIKSTAINKLFSGEMIRATNWDKDRYIVVNEQGQPVDNNGKPFNILTAKEKKWEIYVKPVSKITATDNTELIKMIEALSNKVDKLQQTINNREDNIIIEQEIDSSELIDEVSEVVGSTVEKVIKESLPQEEKSHEETIKIFYGVSTLQDVREQFKNELINCKEKRDTIRVVAKYIPYCWMGARKINTVKRYYTDMRNVIKDVADEWQDLALELFSIPADVYERLNEADRKKVLEKIDTKETFDVTQIKNIIKQLKQHIKKVQSLGDKATEEDFKNNGIPIAKQQKVSQARSYLYATYLALVTGRRNTEILKTLELVQKKDGWYYKGLIKKGTDGIEIKAVSLDNDFNFLKSLIEQIRKDIDTKNLSHQQVNSKYNHIFNRSFKRITGTNFTFHDAREIYAEIAYLEFGKNKGTEREEIDFKSEILGHEIDKDRLVSTEHYMTKKGKNK